MGFKARKIEAEDIKGFVFCEYLGPLPYQTRGDRRDLWALAQIFHEGVARGAYENLGDGEVYMLDIVHDRATTEEESALIELKLHIVRNLRTDEHENLMFMAQRAFTALPKSEIAEIMALPIKRVKELAGE